MLKVSIKERLSEALKVVVLYLAVTALIASWRAWTLQDTEVISTINFLRNIPVGALIMGGIFFILPISAIRRSEQAHKQQGQEDQRSPQNTAPARARASERHEQGQGSQDQTPTSQGEHEQE